MFLKRKSLALYATILLIIGAVVVASPEFQQAVPETPVAQLKMEWSGPAEAQQELGKAFARRWAVWSMMTKEDLRQALMEGDYAAWEATGIPQMLSQDELEVLRRAMTPERLAAFESIEEPMEALWVYPEGAEGKKDCYQLSQVADLLGDSLDVATSSWHLTDSDAPVTWSLDAYHSADASWSGSLEERRELENAFARRWVFWTMATKHDLRHAFEVGDWQAWKATGLTERLSEEALESMRRMVEPEHYAALEVIDEMANGFWVFPAKGPGHCYSLDVVRQLVDRNLEQVEADWRLTD